MKAPADSYPNIDYLLVEKQAAPAPVANLLMARAAAAPVNEAVSTAANDKIMLIDVYNDNSLMDAFVAQFTIDQLINMAGGQPNTGVANTGGMGNLMEYGVPNAMTADGPQGIRIGVHCTAWPVSTNLACTWDVDLVEQVGKAAAIEARTNGIDIWLAPGMDMHRDPLCGRNFEYYSEDPLLTGKMAVALTKGCQSEKVAIALKHFCANEKENNRNSIDSRMSERALREIYIKGFEIAVKEADPWTIMSSYNFLNGTETSENKELLTNILRDEWGFDGIVMTDWGNNSNHAREILAGNDIKMASGNPTQLRTALNNGMLTREDLEKTTKRILEMIMKVNVFDTKIVNPPTVTIGDSTKMKLAENILWSGGSIRGEATGDTDGGQNLGYCDAGAWVQYQIDVQTAGLYDVALRSASNAGGGAVDLLVDGDVVTSFKAVNTGGWQNWTTLEAQKIYLEAGKHEFRVNVTESGSNMNWLQFDLVSSISGNITVEGDIITDAPASLTPAEFKDLFTGSENMVVVDAQGNPVADDKLVGTGCKVQYLDGDKLVKEFTVIVPGDADGDGIRGVMDLLAIKQSILGKEDAQLEGAYFTAADRDGNGKLNIFDLLRVKLDILNGGV